MCQHGCKVCITRMYTCVSTVHIYTYVLHILRMYFTRVFLCMYVYLHGRNTRCVIKCIKWIKKLAPLPAIKHLARPETQFSKVKLFLPSCASSIKNSSPCGNFWKILVQSKLFTLPWIQLSPHCGKQMRIKIILTP